MNFWQKIGQTIYEYTKWCLTNHPGKTTGFLLGFAVAFLFIIFGFWRTLLLLGLSYGGYFFGKCWDEKELPLWLEKLINKIARRGNDNKRQ